MSQPPDGRPPHPVAELARGVETSPGENMAFRTLRLRKLFDEALSIAERAVALNPRDPASLEQMATRQQVETEASPAGRGPTPGGPGPVRGNT